MATSVNANAPPMCASELRLDDSTLSLCHLAALTLLVPSSVGQCLHHSRSPFYGQLEPAVPGGCSDSTGVCAYNVKGAASPNKGRWDQPFAIVTEILKTDDNEVDTAGGTKDATKTRLVFMASPPAGNDANDGLSVNTAVATLSRVHTVVSGMIKTDATSDIEVRIASATYRAQSVRWSAANTMPSQTITLRPLNDSAPMPIFDGCVSPTSCDRPRGFLHLGLAPNQSGTRTNLHVERLDIRNYTSGFSFAGSRDSPNLFVAGNHVNNCIFRRIGNVFNLSLTGCCGAIDGVNTINNTWTGNTFHEIIGTGAHMHVFYLASYSSNNIIAHNVIDGANGDPIRFRDASNGNRVYSNVIKRAGRDAAVQDWYCDHELRSDCTKATAECASWGNIVVNNSVHCNYTGGRLVHVARVWPQAPDKAARCPLPAAGTPRFVIEGNSHNASPCLARILGQRTKSDDVGDGPVMTTSDLNALQANLPARGGAMYLNSSATIVMDSTFVVAKPIHIYGDGTSTILKAGGSIGSFIEVVADGVSLEDLRIEGSKSGVGGTIMRGVLVRGSDCSIRRVAFSGSAKGSGLNFGIDAVSAVGLRIEECHFERGVSSDNNGAAILLEATQRSTLSRNVIDSTEFDAADGIPSAAIMLSAFAGGLGCVDNVIEENDVHNHPQVGIAMQSTTYVQFRGPLGECSRNDFVRNNIRNCGSPQGGEAGSGFAIVSNSHYNRLLNNRITNTTGFGISLVGVYRGDGKTPGTPKLTEIPSFNQILDNLIVGQRGSEKLHVLRTANTTVRDPTVPNRL